MRNKNVIDALHFEFELTHLHLRAFTTINEKQLIVHIDQLRRWMKLPGWRCSAASQYGQFKSHKKKTAPKGGLRYRVSNNINAEPKAFQLKHPNQTSTDRCTFR